MSERSGGSRRAGPLVGLRVVELAGLGPAPFCGMLLADLGADVVTIDRPATSSALGIRPELDVLNRGKRSIALDLKHSAALQTALQLIERADVLTEGYRPGVAEKLGLGPQTCLARNPRLIYGRMTGWGQQGPEAARAGHDINYIALTGALAMIGRHGEPPLAPLNLVADMGGGGMLLAFGVLAALFERQLSGKGQVVDAAMIDGTALQLSGVLGMMAMGQHGRERGRNFIDTGAPFYEVYATSDGRYMAVGAIEPPFYAALCRVANLDAAVFGEQMNPQRWPDQKAALTRIFASRTQAEWTAAFDGVDACVTPVLTVAEAAKHAHHAPRATFEERFGVLQPAPAPRFDRTPGRIGGAPPLPGADSEAVLQEWCGAQA